MSPEASSADSAARRTLVTRIAPTPSGFLHQGNAVNMLLTAWWAHAAGGRLLLRIDDFDTPRLRPEYLADVFDTLDWLGIRADDGPGDPRDFHARWSMSLRREQFARARDDLLAAHPITVFSCRCSRRQLSADGFCVAGCPARHAAFVPRRDVVRLHVPAGTTVTVRTGPEPGLGSAPAHQQLPVPPGDHVLWRRDDLPAYQLGSVVVDESLGVTSVLRGLDLLDSSALQRLLAGLLPAPTFATAELRHHALLHDPQGRKLSKSAGALSAPMPRTAAQRRHVETWATELGAALGILPPASWPQSSGPA